MPEVILSDYFYGAESEEFIYFKIPRLLITDQKFKHVSTDAKLLYGILLDRMGLSAKNNWYDDYGRVYIYYTVDEICEDMCCGRDKAMKLLAELDKKKGIGLVERVKQGQGRPTKLYVKRFTTRTAPSKPDPPPSDDLIPCSEVEKNHPKRSEKSTPRSRKKPTLIKLREISLTLTTLIHPSLPPLKPSGVAMGMDRYELREEVKANIDFENLWRAHPYDDVESLLELVVDVLGSTAPTLRIAGESLPADTVKQRFRKLNSTHIEYTIEAMSQTTTKINNIRAYLLTALYNAPVTMGPYYSAAVRHDFG